MNTELDSLELRVQSDSADAASGLDALVTSLTKLKSAASGGSGLGAVAKQISALSSALSGLNSASAGIANLRSALVTLSTISGTKFSIGTAASQINKLNAAVSALQVDNGKLEQLSRGLSALAMIPKASGFSSTVSSLKKIPEITKDLKSSELQKFSLQIKLVSKYLEPLASVMDRVSKGFDKLPSRIKKVISANASLSSSNSSVTKSFNRSRTSLTNLIAKMGLYGISVRSIVSFLSDAVMSTNEYVENINLFQVSMGEFYDEAFAYAQLVNDKLGVDTSQWIRTQGVFQSIATGFGVTSDQAYALSEGLTELSYDLSSLYNEDVESASLRLQSALAGEIEPIRRLGIAISEASLQEFAMAKGIDETVSNMTEQEKALLRTLKLMEGASDIGAIGDFARTLESPANALRVLKQQLTEFKRAIGSVLIPVLTAVLPYLQAFLDLITAAISAIASLVGFELPDWSDNELNFGSDLSGSAADATEAIDGTTSAVKALKDATLGIDELNVISPNSGSGTGGVTGGSDWASGIEVPDIWNQDSISGMSSKVEEIKNSISRAVMDIGGILGPALLVIGGILTFTGANIPLGLALMAAGAASTTASAQLNWGALNQPMMDVLAALYGAIVGFFLVIGAILAFSGQPAVGIAAMAVGVGMIVGVANLDWAALENPVKSAILAIDGLVAGAFLAVGAVLAFSSTASTPLGIALMAIGAAKIAASVALTWDGVPNEVKNVISAITLIVSGAFLALGAVLAFSGASIPIGIALMLAGATSIVTALALNWDNLTPKIKAAISAVMFVVGGAFLVLGAILTFSGANLFLGIPLLILGAAALVQSMSPNWEAVVSTIKSVIASIGAILGGALIVLGVLLCLTGAGIGLGLAVLFAGLSLVYKAWTLDDNPITEFFKGVVNDIIGLMNGLIDWINELFHIEFDGLVIADVEIIPPIDVRLINLSHIPELASGGILDVGQLFIANEAGPELVGTIGNQSAVANTQQIVQGVANGVAEANMQQNELLREQNELLRAILAKEGATYLDGKKLYKSVEKAARNTGVVIMSGGVV